MISDIDIRITRLLGENGRMSNAEIARRLDVSEGTVRQRIKRLVDSGAVRVTAQVDIEALPDIFYVLVGIEVVSLQDEVVREIDKLPNILFTMNVTGRYDLIALIVARSRPMLYDLITNQLQKVRGVNHTEAFVVLKNTGLWMQGDTFADMLLSEGFEAGGEIPEDTGN
jgi:Lrp/AsnC family transcriptional regulator, regulator for asnA, asnC and gidA